jgi:hypothetical protein
MAEAAAVAVLDEVVSEEARAMLADFLPLMQEVQLQEEIVREPPICGASFSDRCWSTRKLCAASISS